MSFGLILLLLTSLTLGLLPASTRALGVSEIIDLSNAARVDNGLPAFNYNSKLASAAQAKAEHMKANQYFEHIAPDGTTGWYFMEQNGYAYSSAGENLAATNEGSNAVVDGWLNSPGHRANLLSNEYLEVGYGIVYPDKFENYSGIYFVVALYAVPKNGIATAPLSVANTPTPTFPLNAAPDPVVGAESKAGQQVSGPLTVAKQNSSPSIDPRLSLVLFSAGLLMLIIGLSLEIRHFKRKPSIYAHQK
jgi:hypothetical protein